MNNSVNSSTPALNIMSRPSRAKKKRDFGDFVVDLMDSEDGSFVTSTPLLPPTKNRKLNSSGQSHNDEISRSGIVASEIDDEERLGRQSENVSLRDEWGNESAESSMNETGDDNSHFGSEKGHKKVTPSSRGRGRPRGRPRKNEVSNTAKSNSSLYLSLNSDSSKDSKDRSVDSSEIMQMDYGRQLSVSEEIITMKRGRGRPRGRISNSSLSRSRLLGSTKEDDGKDRVDIDLSKNDLELQSLADHSQFLDSNKSREENERISKRGPGRPRGPSKDVMSSHDVTPMGSGNENLESVQKQRHDETKHKRNDDSSLLENSCDMTDYEHRDSFPVSETSTSAKNNDTNVHGNTEKRGRGRPKRSCEINNSLPVKSTVVTENDNLCDEVNEFEDEILTTDDVKVRKDKSSISSIRGKGRPRGRPKKLATTPIDRSIDTVNEDNDVSVNETKDEEREHSKILSTDHLNEESGKIEERIQSVVVKRGRGRPKKDTSSITPRSCDASLNSSFITNEDDGGGSGTGGGEQSGARRRTGRTPKKSKKNLFDGLSSSENGTEDEEDNGNAFIAPSYVRSLRGRPKGTGRGRGRRRGVVRSDNDSNEDLSEDDDQVQRPSPKRGRGRGKASSSPAVKQFNCCHCEEVSKSRAALNYHMMSKHSLVLTKESPQGEPNHKIIIHKMGFIVCQKCQRKFKNPQYFKHHVEWCGREDELFLCHICNKNTKKMWEYQHMQYHKVQVHRKEEALMKQQEKERVEEGETPEAKKDTDRSTKKIEESGRERVDSD